MTPLEILNVALKREEEAYDFYEEMIKKHNSSAIEDILTKLKDSEYKHRKIIEDKISEIRSQ
ncbi:MAG: hypothetical protein COV72_05585 [Candidatus Omnitrophica bacterium CG11_big_fil_rev_8_21_14_0_20_42_13]|uniref:Rubrerythrin diiron-binding domain-containing protein n=1 Tax=Candidatus Ghiorseimicrobium undicola TaxID=1974746 RepID=A0A2H0LX29_9BACT|nr:MAG: hypothetical protein COV72_05585 [Candidatus Omnitrophica bacterium CG11_big_fil_rev_8_21_14_0_20_42_13]